MDEEMSIYQFGDKTSITEKQIIKYTHYTYKVIEDIIRWPLLNPLDGWLYVLLSVFCFMHTSTDYRLINNNVCTYIVFL